MERLFVLSSQFRKVSSLEEPQLLLQLGNHHQMLLAIWPRVAPSITTSICEVWDLPNSASKLQQLGPRVSSLAWFCASVSDNWSSLFPPPTCASPTCASPTCASPTCASPTCASPTCAPSGFYSSYYCYLSLVYRFERCIYRKFVDHQNGD